MVLFFEDEGGIPGIALRVHSAEARVAEVRRVVRLAAATTAGLEPPPRRLSPARPPAIPAPDAPLRRSA
jgi:hypothetical protein